MGMKGISCLVPDWEKVMTKQDAYTNMGIWVEADGWYVEKASNDHMLALHMGGDNWKVQVWNGRDPRPEVAHLINLPTMQV
jgi:hypothetical protein